MGTPNEQKSDNRFQKLIEEDWYDWFSETYQYTRNRLKSSTQLKRDSEDITASVFKSLYRGFSAGRLSSLNDVNELRYLIKAMVRRKIVDRQRYLQRKKRDVTMEEFDEGKVSINYKLLVDTPQSTSPLSRILLKELIAAPLGRKDDLSSSILSLRLQGYDHQEIAQLVDRSPCTISRKLYLIRTAWTKQIIDESDETLDC